MNRPLKKPIAALLAWLICALVLCGCSFNRNIEFDAGVKNENGETTKLSFFGYKYEPLNVEAIERALHGFMDENPGINVSYDSIKSTPYFEILDRRLATGNGDDIFMVDHARALELDKASLLADLGDLSTLDSFCTLAQNQMRVGGRIVYVPTSISAFGLYCNIDLLKRHGQKIPVNLYEFESVCDYFAARGKTPIVANNDISLKTVAIAKALYPIYSQAGYAAKLNQFNTGEADFGAAMLSGFQYVQKIINSGYIDAAQTLQTEKTQDDLTDFARGQSPFMLTGAWAVARLRELKPSFDFTVTPYPILEDGGVLVINMDTRISVNADSANLTQAKAFVEYFTRKDVMWKLVNSQSSFSPLKENRLAEEKAVQSLGAYINNGRSVIGADDTLRFPVWDLTKECIRLLLNGGTAEEAAALLRENIDVRETKL